MSDSRKKWEEMREEDRQGKCPQYFGRADRQLVKKPSVEKQMDELEKKISKQTELLEEILKNLG